jgi:hypothetical protein
MYFRYASIFFAAIVVLVCIFQISHWSLSAILCCSYLTYCCIFARNKTINLDHTRGHILFICRQPESVCTDMEKVGRVLAILCNFSLLQLSTLRCSVYKLSVIPVSDETADIVDVVYVNIVIWSVGCLRVGEAARGKQLIANQGQEWMGIRTKSKKSWFSK